MKTVEIEKPVRLALQRMPRPTSERTMDKIEQYAADPASLATQVKALAGDHRKRLKVGDWRVLFLEDARTVIVLDVRPRGSAYR